MLICSAVDLGYSLYNSEIQENSFHVQRIIIFSSTNQRRKNRCSCTSNRHIANRRSGSSGDFNAQDYCEKKGFLAPSSKMPKPRNRNGNRLQKRMLSQGYSRV